MDSDGKDSKGRVAASTKLSRCRKILPLANRVLGLERKHPLQIDVLSLKQPLKVADRGSKCGAIVAVIACCRTCGGSRRETLRDSDRVNDGRPDSHHQPRCAQIYGTAEVKTDKLDPGGGGRSPLLISSLNVSS